jgi:Ca-activated chloride channel family protein
MTKLVRFLILFSFLAAFCDADIGALIPGNREEPDPGILTIDEARIQIRIDHQYARIRILQIFGNHANTVQEGKFVFAIPGDAAISDFAVWDGVVRIPGVILERKRASEIYEQLRMQEIDPGLLQQEEAAEEGPRMANVFSAKIVPIPAYGTKRLEMEYTQKIPVDGMKSYFSLPLKPDLYRVQTVGSFSLDIEILSDAPIVDFQLLSQIYPVQFTSQSPQHITGSFHGNNVQLNEDFGIQYRIDQSESALYFLPFRGTERNLRGGAQPVTAFQAPANQKVEDGHFWLSAILNESKADVSSAKDFGGRDVHGTAKSLVILMDTSSSMRWEKLEQSYAALDYFLHHLNEQDEFLLVLFHQETKAHAPAPVPATKENIDAALNFFKAQYLMGGTDFQKAFQEAFRFGSQLKNRERYLVMITDGNPTLTQLQTKKLIQSFQQGNPRFRAFCFGIGSDSNRNLLSQLAEKSNGHFDWVTENEDMAFKLEAFFAKVGQYPVANLQVKASQPDLLYQVYPGEPASAYNGSSIDWFGRYKTPAKNVVLTVNGQSRDHDIHLEKTVDLPEEATEHDFVPRGWARRRVDALLRKMDLEGEDQASIDEIIALAKKYKFVTPYTSFLAAPRSLLRPRLIRPGDPLLRIKTDPDIVSITAIFPFGLIKNLEYLSQEDVWQTRFLVPKSMKDGTYHCRIILRDKKGIQYQESKSFLIDSRAPIFQARWEGRFKSGQKVKIIVSADQDTRYLFARLDLLPPVRIEWSQRDKASVGYLILPQHFVPGTYNLQIFGEDFAHNQSRLTRKVEVL